MPRMKSAPCCIQCPKSRTSRRQWLKQLTMSCGSLVAVRNGIFTPDASALDNRNKLRIDLNLLPVLDLNGGSAMLTYDSEQTVLLVNRESETDFHVLDPRCTHQGCRIDPYSPSTASAACPCHGSEYDIAGHVTRGPAVNNLNFYAATLETPTTLAVEIGGFFHQINAISLHSQSPTNVRLRISFPTLSGATYALKHAPMLEETFVPIGFTTTPNGTTFQSTLLANGSQTSVYVDAAGATGFFSLDLIVFQIA